MNEPVFIICVNQPGCLPEGEPYAVHGLDRAHDAIADEIRSTGEAHECHEFVVDTALDWARTFDANGASIEMSGYVHEAIPAQREGRTQHLVRDVPRETVRQ